jgi:hypothetical protein
LGGNSKQTPCSQINRFVRHCAPDFDFIWRFSRQTLLFVVQAIVFPFPIFISTQTISLLQLKQRFFDQIVTEMILGCQNLLQKSRCFRPKYSAFFLLFFLLFFSVFFVFFFDTFFFQFVNEKPAKLRSINQCFVL